DSAGFGMPARRQVVRAALALLFFSCATPPDGLKSKQSAITGPPTVGLVAYSATLLGDGSVLVAGGQDANGTTAISYRYVADPPTASDPSGESGTFTRMGDLSTPRSGHSATRLLDGRVFVAGGTDGKTLLGTLEAYDPNAGTFAPLDATLLTARRGH